MDGFEDVLIGTIGRAHGLRGEVSVRVRTDEPDLRYVAGGSVLIDGRGGVQDTIGGVDWDQDDSDGIDYTYYDQGYDAPSAYNGYSYGEGSHAAPPAGSAAACARPSAPWCCASAR